MSTSILLIEDDKIVRENTGEILELAGYKVTTAENGKFGVEKAKENHPDLIICDIMMPELDGYGVLYLLSKDKDLANVPFIYLSAKAERSDMRKGMDLGADDYLTKPFEESELLNAIESRLKRSEKFKSEFRDTADDLSIFINEARGLEELQKLSNEREMRKYTKNDNLYLEGNYPNGLFFLSKGKVKTFKLNQYGKELVTGLFKDGDFFGYLPLLGNTPYGEFAVAMEDCETYKIPKEDFNALITKNRDVAHKFIKMLSSNLAEKEDQLMSLAYDSVRKKTAESLLLLQKRFKVEGDVKFKMGISRDDLASIAGTATESLIRALADFKEEKLIKTEGITKIVILDCEGLEKIRG